jgi:hypothetical protein
MIKEIELRYTQPQLEIFFEWPDGVRFKGVQKGRRFGATKGAANAIIEWCLEGISPILWGDTIHGNIDRYFERYFLPELKKNEIEFSFDKAVKKLKIGNSVVDFRSADNPENWEGFGYMLIFLNEAGIILKNRYLWTNAVLPMLMDYPNSRLIAAGVPKGKILRDGTEHPFYSICKKTDDPTYKIHKYSSYDNPLLGKSDIDDLAKEIGAMSESMVQQEIYGDFVEATADNPFFYAFDPAKHVSKEAVYDEKKQLYISIDFNLNPFGCIFGHIWNDGKKEHLHIFDEMSISHGSVPEMIDQIKNRYSKKLSTCFLTGDAMGNRGEISQRDNASLYLQLQRGLGLSPKQLRVLPNPTHENSRVECNYVLANFDDVKINPDKCQGLVRDMKLIQCDSFGGIIKKNRKDVSQQADLGDCKRYFIHSFLRDWIYRNMKLNKK